MWEATVRVTREQEVDADPERVWALAAAPAALAAMPGHRFAFAVPATVPGTDRLCCMIVSGKHDVHCAVVDVREEIPGQLIRWQVRSAPGRKETLTLSVRPRTGGCTLSASVSEVVPRIDKGSYQKYWRRTIADWASRLQAIAEGRMPWPADVMSAEMRDVCAGFELPKKTGEAAASAVINADADTVWETVWAPDASRLIDPETVVWAGTVPGTPQRAVGELQYTVHRHPDDRFTAIVYVVKELTEGRRAVTQRIGNPDTEMLHLLTPVPEGTRLELTARWPAPTVRKTHATAAADTVATHLQETADAYKEHIEKAAGTSRRGA
jgi:hypothetical protein